VVGRHTIVCVRVRLPMWVAGRARIMIHNQMMMIRNHMMMTPDQIA
jgi:hypothetical protein